MQIILLEKENEEQALSRRGGTYQVWSPLHGRGGVPAAVPAVWPVPASRAAKKGKPQPLAVPRRRCVRSPRCQGASEQTGQGASMVWDSATRRRPGRWLRWWWRLWSVAGPLRTRQPRGTLLAITCSGERGFGLCWCHQHGHSPDTARRDTAAGLAEQELTGGAGVAVSCAGSKVSR